MKLQESNPDCFLLLKFMILIIFSFVGLYYYLSDAPRPGAHCMEPLDKGSPRSFENGRVERVVLYGMQEYGL